MRSRVFNVINTKLSIAGEFKPLLFTVCATSNDAKRECVTVKGSRVWIGAGSTMPMSLM